MLFQGIQKLSGDSKGNFSLKRKKKKKIKVTPYLLKLTMMKGNEDSSFSCRYQYKYYSKVN